MTFAVTKCTAVPSGDKGRCTMTLEGLLEKEEAVLQLAILVDPTTIAAAFASTTGNMTQDDIDHIESVGAISFPCFYTVLYDGVTIGQCYDRFSLGIRYFAWPFFYFTRERENFCSPQDRLYFHHALWPFIYFTHFPHKNIYFQKSPAPPPSILMVAPYNVTW